MMILFFFFSRPTTRSPRPAPRLARRLSAIRSAHTKTIRDPQSADESIHTRARSLPRRGRRSANPNDQTDTAHATSLPAKFFSVGYSRFDDQSRAGLSAKPILPRARHEWCHYSLTTTTAQSAVGHTTNARRKNLPGSPPRAPRQTHGERAECRRESRCPPFPRPAPCPQTNPDNGSRARPLLAPQSGKPARASHPDQAPAVVLGILPSSRPRLWRQKLLSRSLDQVEKHQCPELVKSR